MEIKTSQACNSTKSKMYVPFVGRLSLREWPIVVMSLLFTYVEFVISIITKFLPDDLIHFFTKITNNIYLLLYQQEEESNPTIILRNRLRNAKDIHEICDIFNYQVNDHIVTTKDNYLLCLHRIPPKTEGAPVVYLHHGLMMCSDVWCCSINKHQNLPFVLHDLGYDVWLGNNRSNKYSTKHLTLKQSDLKFWDFSIDEFAIFDIPDSINYILSYTKQNDLTYIGFSQGSAQTFASLSINPDLNQKIKLFIALAPAMTPRGLHHKFVDTLMKTSPNLMYLIFGKKNLLASVSFWTSIIYPPLLTSIIDFSNHMLFNWKSQNIRFNQKISCFAHLYSPTSVKSVVHWFQIIRNRHFQMFDENLFIFNNNKSYKTPIFPTKTNIKTPIVLIYGDSDSLVDIEEMKKLLPEEYLKTIPIKGYEHLDIIWGDDVETLVIPRVLNLLDNSPDSKIKISTKRPTSKPKSNGDVFI